LLSQSRRNLLIEKIEQGGYTLPVLATFDTHAFITAKLLFSKNTQVFGDKGIQNDLPREVLKFVSRRTTSTFLISAKENTCGSKSNEQKYHGSCMKIQFKMCFLLHQMEWASIFTYPFYFPHYRSWVDSNEKGGSEECS